MSEIDPNKKYRTRDGREVRIYATGLGGLYPVHGAINIRGDDWIVTSWMRNGSSFSDITADADLVEVKPRHKRTVWVNCYPNGRYLMWKNKRTADTLRDSGAIACIRVELDFEEGEGL